MLGFMLWLMTFIITYLIARLAVKIDYKRNYGYVVSDFEDGALMCFALAVMLIPIVNILASIIMLCVILHEAFDGSFDLERIIKKFFFIKQDKY